MQAKLDVIELKRGLGVLMPSDMDQAYSTAPETHMGQHNTVLV